MSAERVIQENVAEQIRHYLETNNIEVVERNFWNEMGIEECVC